MVVLYTAEICLWILTFYFFIMESIILYRVLHLEYVTENIIDNYTRKNDLCVFSLFMCLTFIGVLQLIDICLAPEPNIWSVVLWIAVMIFDIIMTVRVFYKAYHNQI